MKCFPVFLVYFFVRAGCESIEPYKGDSSVAALASVREFPSLLHKCMATFIKPDVLVTTARCLFCDDDCPMFVHALSSSLTDEQQSAGVSINITTSVTHPDYERFPHKNDVGIIKLKEKVKGAVIFDLPTKVFDLGGLQVDAYTWKFTKNLREYHLTKQPEKTISNALCSLVHNQYIDYQHICTRREQAVALGPFDQGSPITSKVGQSNVILGIYGKEESFLKTKFEVYQAVQPFVGWIQKLINCDFKCAASVSDESEAQHFPLDGDSNVGTSYDKSVTATPNTAPAYNYPPTNTKTSSLIRENQNRQKKISDRNTIGRGRQREQYPEEVTFLRKQNETYGSEDDEKVESTGEWTTNVPMARAELLSSV